MVKVGRVPPAGVSTCPSSQQTGPKLSVCHDGQRLQFSFARGSDRVQCHVSGFLDDPFVVLLKEDGTDQEGNDCLAGESADNPGSSLDFADGDYSELVQCNFIRCTSGEAI